MRRRCRRATCGSRSRPVRLESVSSWCRPARSPIGQRAAMSYIGLAYIGAVARSGPRAGAIRTPDMTDTTSIQHPAPLTSGDFTAAEEPYALFGEWFAEACKAEPNDPNAMALATVDPDGLPDVRMVLMKGFDTEGFVFYSHIASQKGRELATNPKAALLFHWKSLRRQVRIRGNVTPVTDAEADAYFATRPKQAQIGAWASQQSQPLESRFAFERPAGRPPPRYIVGEVPRPPGWSGWRIAPTRCEFWHDRPYRLHD